MLPDPADAWLALRARKRLATAIIRGKKLRRTKNPLRGMSDQIVKERYRFLPENIFELIALLKPYLKRNTLRSQALSAEYQVLITLRFLACGSYYHVMEESNWMSK